jgi:hypothetical protein
LVKCAEIIMRTRVVMAVNNPATNDYRVVKSAEMVARAGFECHVVGVLKPGFKTIEVVNGVTYHRVKLSTSLHGYFAGFLPRAYVYLKSDSGSGYKESTDSIKQNYHKRVSIWLIINKIYRNIGNYQYF